MITQKLIPKLDAFFLLNRNLSCSPFHSQFLIIDFLLQIYPNPSSDFISVEPDEIQNSSRISIFSMTGQLLIEEEGYGKKCEIDVSALKSGVYVVKYESQEYEFSTRFVKE